MIKINLRKRIKKRLTEKKAECGDKVEAKSGGECGPGMHRHPDVYHDKCHPIEYKHRRKQVGPNKKGTGDATRKIKKPKKLSLKKLQLGRPL